MLFSSFSAMAYFTQHTCSSVPFLRPLRTPSTVCVCMHAVRAEVRGQPLGVCSHVGSYAWTQAVQLLCSHLSNMQYPRTHSFIHCYSSSWLPGLQLRWHGYAMAQMLTSMSSDVCSRTAGHMAAQFSFPSRLTNFISPQCGRASCPPVHGSMLLVTAIQIRVRWNLTVILNYISLWPDGTEYYFIYLLVICEVPIWTTCLIFNLDDLVFV